MLCEQRLSRNILNFDKLAIVANIIFHSNCSSGCRQDEALIIEKTRAAGTFHATLTVTFSVPSNPPVRPNMFENPASYSRPAAGWVLTSPRSDERWSGWRDSQVRTCKPTNTSALWSFPCNVPAMKLRKSSLSTLHARRYPTKLGTLLRLSVPGSEDKRSSNSVCFSTWLYFDTCCYVRSRGVLYNWTALSLISRHVGYLAVAMVM